jgi:hypothetical protein
MNNVCSDFCNLFPGHDSRTYLKDVDQGSGQGEDPELVVGDAGRSAFVKTTARQVKKRSPAESGMSPAKSGKPTRNPAPGGTMGP